MNLLRSFSKLCFLFGIVLSMCLVSTNLNAMVGPRSNSSIYGKVTDDDSGEGVPYVTVFIKGSNIAATTDVNGKYILKNVPLGKITLVVSSVGYFPESRVIRMRHNNSLCRNFSIKQDRMALNSVVVSANREQTLRMQAPVVVSVMNNKLFNTTASTSLAQGLNFQPGVRVEDNCQNCGFSQVRINGLDGQYSQILIDSRPIFSALNGVYGLDQIPSNMIERVEIVRGGGSALFGSSAIGGTINIITKEPTRNSAEISTINSATQGFDGLFSGLTSDVMFNASVVTPNNKAGFMVYGQSRNRGAVDIDGDGYSEIPRLFNKTIGMRSYLKLSETQKVTVDFHSMMENRRGGSMIPATGGDDPLHDASITESLHHNIIGGALNYDFLSLDAKNKVNVYSSFQSTRRRSYYGGTLRYVPRSEKSLVDTLLGSAKKAGLSTIDTTEISKLKDLIDQRYKSLNAYGLTRELTVVSGIQYTHNFDNLLFMPANLTLGLEHTYDYMKDEPFNGFTKLDTREQTLNNFSLYGQNEWNNDMFTFLLGARIDKHQLLKYPIFSPRINFRFRPSRFVNLRASYSTGYRAPQIFDEDLHTELAGGERVVIHNAANLKPEFSHSFSLSADTYFTVGKLQGNILAEGFYTILDDAFTIVNTGKEIRGAIEKLRENTSGRKVYGLNLDGKIAYSTWMDLQAGITLQRNIYNKPEFAYDPAEDDNKGLDPRTISSINALRSPNVYGYFTMNFYPMKHMTTSFSGTYTGSMYVAKDAFDDTDSIPYYRNNVMLGKYAPQKANPNEIVKTPTFLTIDWKLSYDFKIFNSLHLILMGGIKNIFNSYQKDFFRGPKRNPSYIYGPQTPRTVYFGIKFKY